jgi:hypothetical protein
MDLRVAGIRRAEGCLRAAECHPVVDTAVPRKADLPAVTAVRPRAVLRPAAVATVARRKVVRPAVATEVRLPAASVVLRKVASAVRPAAE